MTSSQRPGYSPDIPENEMVVGRPFSEICRELAEAAAEDGLPMLAQLLRMAAIEAAENGARRANPDLRVRELLVGTWDWDVLHDKVYTDTRFARLFGISPEDAATGAPLDLWLKAIHPDDVAEVTAEIKLAVMTGKLFAKEYRLVCRGEIHWVYARGKCIMDKSGTAVRFPGAVVDITHEKLDV